MTGPAPGVVFYLGTHRAHWLATSRVPLFISHRTLATRRSLPRAACRWALDSGGFTELLLHGRYKTSARTYALHVQTYAREIGTLDFASVQDWMCEPQMRSITGLSVREHQRRTIDSYLELRALAPRVRWLPVVQGWDVRDYLEHVDAYARAGVDLRRCARVGVGSICRRQRTHYATSILHALAARGLKLHGFGLKQTSLRTTRLYMHSADSMAWSYRERVLKTGLSNDRATAEAWRDKLVAQLDDAERARTRAINRWQLRADYSSRTLWQLMRPEREPNALELAHELLVGADAAR